ncbi:pX [Siadenovirus carbocapituli]|uniref:PX n=1 Tax=Siadenovirus sp. TaxID=2671519 RepID=A0A9E7QWK2_9ADEN|nr:pX [Siadenovirus sp.]
MFENLAPRKGMSTKIHSVRFNREMRGGFLSLLVPIIASAIGAIPGIASAVIQAKQSER